LRVAIAAKNSQIFYPVVKPVAIDVVELERRWLPSPFGDLAPAALGFKDSCRVETLFAWCDLRKVLTPSSKRLRTEALSGTGANSAFRLSFTAPHT
jgi:hypothetical protein